MAARPTTLESAYDTLVSTLAPDPGAPALGGRGEALAPPAGEGGGKRDRENDGARSPSGGAKRARTADGGDERAEREGGGAGDPASSPEHSSVCSGGSESGESHGVADGSSVAVPLAPVARSRNLGGPSSRLELSLAARHAARAPRMLIADDSYTVRRFMQRTFEQRGYAVDVAQNGWQAFAQMQTRLYDFVFLDIEMPVMNGYRCAQALRKWEHRVKREQRQFICALTSHSKPAERELGIGIGMNLFESKPAKPKRLLDIVEQALAAANGNAPAAAAIAAAATAMACGPSGAGVLDLGGADDATAADAPTRAAGAAFDLALAGLGPDDKAQMALCATSGLAWVNVRVTAEAPGGRFDVEATDGTGIVARGVHRRRLRVADQAQPVLLAPGLDVDAVHAGALHEAAVVAAATAPGHYTLKLATGAVLDDVPRDMILATHE